MSTDLSLRSVAAPTGVGLGLRGSFLAEVDAGAADGRVPFFEISPENHMRRGGPGPARLARVRERFPVLTHGLSMSLGGLEPFDPEYFADLRQFLAAFGNHGHGSDPWHSDHLCFCGTDGKQLHDLLPVPFTGTSARRIAARVREAADRLGRPMAVENISYYLPLGVPSVDEPEFIAELLERADCGLVLDVNNVFVNAKNHGFDARAWLARIPLARVVQLHVAGHEFWDDDAKTLIIDTHGAPVRAEVDDLLAWVIERTGPLPVLLERDNNIPALAELLAERDRLQTIYDQALARWHAKEAP
jgi:uncharacterized protein (UPF0276 family)